MQTTPGVDTCPVCHEAPCKTAGGHRGYEYYEAAKKTPSKAAERVAFGQEILRANPTWGVERALVEVRERFGMGCDTRPLYDLKRLLRADKSAANDDQPKPVADVPARAQREPGGSGVSHHARRLLSAMKAEGCTEVRIGIDGRMTITRPAVETVDLDTLKGA